MIGYSWSKHHKHTSPAIIWVKKLINGWYIPLGIFQPIVIYTTDVWQIVTAPSARSLIFWRHDIQHNDTQHNDTLLNLLYCDTLHLVSLCWKAPRSVSCFIYFMLSVILLNVIMLSVVAPIFSIFARPLPWCWVIPPTHHLSDHLKRFHLSVLT